MRSDLALDPPADPKTAARGAGLELFAISVLLLFLELTCIRWFPAHVLFLTFFTNTVLLACFLGMSLGCLAADRPRTYLVWTPILLAWAMATAYSVEVLGLREMIDVGNQQSPQMVFFGTEGEKGDIANFFIPIELLGGFFFLIITLAMIGPGQELGRAFNRVPDRVTAYTLNILGSLVGIVLFAALSWLELPPFWWFLPALLLLDYFLAARKAKARWIARWAGVAVLALSAWTSYAPLRDNWNLTGEHYWSPYYRIDYSRIGYKSLSPPDPAFTGRITVNQIGHQQMTSRQGQQSGYLLPYALRRDSRKLAGHPPSPIKDILIIGAGSGNDVSRALQASAPDVHVHIDAVEIDPVIQRLGAQDHPDQPYRDSQVHVHLDDGRNFLRSTQRKYDLVIYALVDSLVLHSSYSNIRLESYLFTRQAFVDVKRCLKDDGLFVMYNYFRQGWIVARLHQALHEVFPEYPPLVFTLPGRATVEPEEAFGGFTLFFVDKTKDMHAAFNAKKGFQLHKEDDSAKKGSQPHKKDDPPNGFLQDPPDPNTINERWFVPATVKMPEETLRPATDDWPFLYLRKPMIPNLSLRGMAIMGGLAVLLLFLFLPRKQGEKRNWGFDPRMFFLGAGFMLVETKAVVQMALLFGSTWMVNTVVFFAVLVMILGANLFVLKVRPRRLWPFYVGLLVSLALNVVVPLDSFLGMHRWLQILGSCVLVFAPILFAGVVFAVSFSGVGEPDRALAANIAGAMLGGLAEYSSMLIGFQYLVLVAIVFYLLSAIVMSRRAAADLAVK